MSEDIEEKFEEYMEKLESTEDVEERLKILGEARAYLTGIIDSGTNSLKKTVGSLYIKILHMMEILLIQERNMQDFTENINERLTNLEERVTRIEDVLKDELEFRRKYK
jgi:hypothetical protein